MNSDDCSDEAFIKLLTWLSPSFPVGAYAYSHGLEFAVKEDLVSDAITLQDWIEGIITYGVGHTDGIIFSETWRAVKQVDDNLLFKTLEIARAYQPTAELKMETTAQGTAFLKAVCAAWPSDHLTRLLGKLIDDPEVIPYPVAVALVSARYHIPLNKALTAYLHAFSANLVSAGVRLIPLGQEMGLRVLAGLDDRILESSENYSTLSLDRIGSATMLVDWTSARHETQYTRLFRS